MEYRLLSNLPKAAAGCNDVAWIQLLDDPPNPVENGRHLLPGDLLAEVLHMLEANLLAGVEDALVALQILEAADTLVVQLASLHASYRKK